MVTVMPYALEQLFLDQDRDWVVETIAPVLAWVPGGSERTRAQPFRFELDHTQEKTSNKVLVELSWNEGKLEPLVPGLGDHVRRLRSGRTAQREHLTELAAYGLTFVAISLLMPGRRVVHMQMGVAPDMLFDVTPAALRGVETAGRRKGGMGVLRTVRNGTRPRAGKPGRVRQGKAPTLIARADIAEVHLSLWCGSPRVAMMEQLKP